MKNPDATQCPAPLGADESGKLAFLEAHDALAITMRDVMRMTGTAGAAMLRPLGLTPAQAQVLRYVSRVPGSTQIELSEYVGVGGMGMTGLIDRMEAKALLERRPDATDRRAKRIHLTAKGTSMVPPVQAIYQRLISDAFGGIDSAELDGVASALGRVLDNLTALAERHSNPPS